MLLVDDWDAASAEEVTLSALLPFEDGVYFKLNVAAVLGPIGRFEGELPESDMENEGVNRDGSLLD